MKSSLYLSTAMCEIEGFSPYYWVPTLGLDGVEFCCKQGFEQSKNLRSLNCFSIHPYDRTSGTSLDAAYAVYHINSEPPVLWRISPNGYHCLETMEWHLDEPQSLEKLVKTHKQFQINLADAGLRQGGLVIDLAHINFAIHRGMPQERIINCLSLLNPQFLALHLSAFTREIVNEKGLWAGHGPLSIYTQKDTTQSDLCAQIIKEFQPNTITLEGICPTSSDPFQKIRGEAEFVRNSF